MIRISNLVPNPSFGLIQFDCDNAVLSKNVTKKSCLVCDKSEKYASWVTLRPQSDCYRRGEAEVRILDFKTTWSEFQKPYQTAVA